MAQNLVSNKVAGWESLPVYNSIYAGANPIPDLTPFGGWSGPIAAAGLLNYFKNKQGTGVQSYMPMYVGKGNDYSYLNSHPYGYPNWREFILDSNRPARNVAIDDFDCTDFGWFMNTNNIGTNTLSDNPGGFVGTTAKNLFNGLTSFYNHIGHTNRVQAYYPFENKLNYTIPSSFFTNSSFATIGCNFVSQTVPVGTYATGSSPTAGAAPGFQFSDNSRWILKTFSAPVTFRITGTLIYNSTTNNTFSAKLAYNNGSVETSFVIVPSHATSGGSVNFTKPFSVQLTMPANCRLYLFYSGGDHSVQISTTSVTVTTISSTTTDGPDISGIASGTAPNTVIQNFIDADKPLLVMTKAALVPTGINTITFSYPTNGEYSSPAMQAYFSSTSQYHEDVGSSYPLNISNDPTLGIGNVYIVIGYIYNSTDSSLPIVAQNKNLILLKGTGSDRDKNYWVADTFLGISGEIPFTSATMALYFVDISASTYTSPRTAITANQNWGAGCCAEQVKVLTAPVVTGTPHQHRFTDMNNGYPTSFTYNPGSGPITEYEPPSPVSHSFGPGNYTINFRVTDAVSDVSGSYPLVVASPVPAEFFLESNLGQSIIGTSINVSTTVPYWFKEDAGYMGSADLSQVVVTKGNGSPATAGVDYVISTSNPGNLNLSTNPVMYIKFITAGTYLIIRTATNQYCTSVFTITVNAQAVTALIDFTWGSPLAGFPTLFTDTSPVVTSSWAWTFGDGGTGSVENPSHTYLAPSVSPYPVFMTADTIYGRLTVEHDVTVYYGTATADFYYAPTVGLIAGVSGIAFTPVCSPSHPSFNPTYAWDFGDGKPVSHLVSPTHMFDDPGTYTVTLVYTVTVNGVSLSATVSKTITILASELKAKSTTIITARNISKVIDIRPLTNGDSDAVYTVEKVPSHGTVTQEVGSMYNFTYQPAENYVGMDSFKYRVANSDTSRIGKISFIVRPPQLELIVGGRPGGFSLTSNRFGDFDVSFGSVEIDNGNVQITSSSTKVLLLTNVGTGDLHIDSISLEGQDADLFELEDMAEDPVTQFEPMILVPTASFEFKLKFSPTSVGKKRARIKIVHN